MVNEIVILQIVLITVIVYFSRLVFNKIFGQSSSERRELINKTKDIQNRLNQAMGDAEEFKRLQDEYMGLMKQMMIKQMIPMCACCIIFWVLWVILGIIYVDYSKELLPFPVLFFGDGWIGLYILTSFSLFGISYLIRYIYRKIKGIESTSLWHVQSKSQSSLFAIPTRSQLKEVSEKPDDEYIEDEKMRKDAWKDKIKS